jgi:hypothetical protein
MLSGSLVLHQRTGIGCNVIWWNASALAVCLGSHGAALLHRVHATAPLLRLITFDADGTLYADGAHIEHDNRMIDEIIELLVRGVHVSIVTAAGYPGDSRAFEARTQGLLDAFASRQLVREVTDRFSLLGGECNYLLKCVARMCAW